MACPGFASKGGADRRPLVAESGTRQKRGNNRRKAVKSFLREPKEGADRAKMTGKEGEEKVPG